MEPAQITALSAFLVFSILEKSPCQQQSQPYLNGSSLHAVDSSYIAISHHNCHVFHTTVMHHVRPLAFPTFRREKTLFFTFFSQIFSFTKT
jgi:hypothetical protein